MTLPPYLRRDGIATAASLSDTYFSPFFPLKWMIEWGFNLRPSSTKTCLLGFLNGGFDFWWPPMRPVTAGAIRILGAAT